MSDLLDTPVTFLPDVRKPHVFDAIPLKRALGWVKNGKYKEIIDAAQLDLLIGDDKGYREKKSRLPSYCFHGTFNGSVVNENFVASSGLALIDIDNLDPEPLAETKRLLSGDSRTVFLHESPSGRGIKVAFRVDPTLIKSDADFKLAFAQIASELEALGITVDASGKDLRRVSFVGNDPELYFNRNAEIFNISLDAKPLTRIALVEEAAVATEGYSPITEDDSVYAPLPDITLENAAMYLPTGGEQSRAEWLAVGAALHHQFSGSEEALVIFDSWSQNVRAYAGFEDVAKTWKSFGKRSAGKVVTFRTLVQDYNKTHIKQKVTQDNASLVKAKKILEACTDHMQLVRDIAPKLKRLADKNVVLEKAFTAALRERYAVLHEGHVLSNADALRAMKMKHATNKAVVPAELVSQLTTDDYGKYPATIQNVVAAASCPAFCGMVIGLDSFSDSIMFHTGDEQWQLFLDVHYTDLKLALADKNFHDISTERIRETVHKVASVNVFDSAQTWLSSLKWDGVPRVEGFLKNYLGTEDTPYTKAVSRYIWSAMAGRIMVPGTKVDMVPILEGKQGCGKSTAIGSMVPSLEHFCEFSFTEKEDDIARKFRGRLVAELGELKGLNSRDEDHIKAFVVRRIEQWTPKYKEYVTQYPRRVVIFGTTNQKQFLSDPTGNRRWLPFSVGKIKNAAISADCNQLWAEGVHVFAKYGIAYEEAERLAVFEHKKFEIKDDWEQPVEQWLTGANEIDMVDVTKGVTTLEILSGALRIEPKHAGQHTRRQVNKIMTNLGYESKQAYRDGLKGYFWFKNEEIDLEDLI